MSNSRLNLVVACCNNNGIGINGTLPWILRKDMDFFKKITSETKDTGKQNAVIMGRKTWFGIPEKFRPLRNRVNIVLSRELKDVAKGVYVCRSLPEAVDLVREGRVGDIDIESVHVIGGSSVYEECMKGSYNCRIYLTRIFADFECDTFMPALDENVFRKVENPLDIPSTEEQEENGIKFKFEVYDKISTASQTFSEPHSVDLNKLAIVDNKMNAASMESVCDKQNDQSKHGRNQILSTGQSELQTHQMEGSLDQSGNCIKELQPIKFNVMAAMCSSNRGMGYKERLPWPKIRQDYEYYLKKTSTFVGENTGDKLIIHISGRISWEGCDAKQRYLDRVRQVIVSRSLLQSGETHPRILKVVPSFPAAVEFCNSPGVRERLDSVWVMGGSRNYEEAVHHPLCDRVYMTHVYTTFPADVFFPEFEPLFEEICENNDGPGVIEENGVKYEFKVYKKKN